MPKNNGPKWIERKKASAGRKVVSVRVPVEVHAAFQEAVRLIEAKGDKLSLTRVVEIAMRDAIAEVEQIYGVDCFQADLERSLTSSNADDDGQQGLF